MNSNIVRAWKDEFYRQSLSDEERAQLPENPVGELELTETELESVFAGHGNEPLFSGHEWCEHTLRGYDCPTHNFEHYCIHPQGSFDPDSCYNSYHLYRCPPVTYNHPHCYLPENHNR